MYELVNLCCKTEADNNKLKRERKDVEDITESFKKTKIELEDIEIYELIVTAALELYDQSYSDEADEQETLDRNFLIEAMPYYLEYTHMGVLEFEVMDFLNLYKAKIQRNLNEDLPIDYEEQSEILDAFFNDYKDFILPAVDSSDGEL